MRLRFNLSTWWGRGLAATAALAGAAWAGGPAEEFSPQERRLLAQHSPLPALPPSETNRLADNPDAARFGQALFFEPRLSANGQVSCATCHDPGRSFADGRPLSEGLGAGHRNSPSLWNVAYGRWFFWDGRSDSLWAQALQPLERDNEMGSNRVAIVRHVARDAKLRAAYEAIFGRLPDFDAGSWPSDACPPDFHVHAEWNAAWAGMSAEQQRAINEAFANLGKAIEAYERRLVSRDAPFDRFVRGLENGAAEDLGAISAGAQRGAKFFVGRGQCRLCHSGPNFSDGEFHNIRVPPRVAGSALDPGRYPAIDELKRDVFRSSGVFSDAPGGAAAQLLEFVVSRPDHWGAMKTPSLRNVAQTAPYMHQGQFAHLDDVLHYYSTLEGAVQVGHHAETILQPLRLTPQEQADLKAFLESLTDEGIADELRRAPAGP